MKEKFRRYGKLCWRCKVEYNIVEACTLFEICTATLANGLITLYSQRSLTRLRQADQFARNLPSKRIM
jgi:hypothetical protein